jgi:hypothetical protein
VVIIRKTTLVRWPFGVHMLHELGFLVTTLRYTSGIFYEGMKTESIRLSDATGQSVRWIGSSLLGLEVHRVAFDGQSSEPVLQGDSGLLVRDWAMKLGFRIDPLGPLSRIVPSRTEASATNDDAER